MQEAGKTDDDSFGGWVDGGARWRRTIPGAVLGPRESLGAPATLLRADGWN